MLYGQIPSELNSVPSLQTLSVFRIAKPGPRLSGALPAFSGLPQLAKLLLHGNELQGSIPYNFVSASKSVALISLSSNLLTGNVPEDIGSIPSLTLELDGNQIEDFPFSFCQKKNWMGGAVGKFGCAAFLCPPGTASKMGKTLSEEVLCDNCTVPGDAPYYGSKSCAGSRSQREILMSFYHAVNGRSWYRNDFWGSTADVCDWYGIGCNGEHVVQINLRGNNLEGVPPPDLFFLRELKILWLYSNPISFSFENIESAKKLEDLRLDSTRLHSFHGIGAATSLVSFDARFTKVRGPFPEEMLKLTNLRHLALSHNAMLGTIPKSFSDLKFLASLSLDSNQLSGRLPTFDDMHFLRYLDLSDNSFTGAISRDFLMLLSSNIEPTIKISKNLLTGVIPEEFSRFDRLKLYLADNKILGLPLTLCYNDKWNDGDVGNYWCDGILCKPGSFNLDGRKTPYQPRCKPCQSAVYYGSRSCDDKASSTQRLGLTLPILIGCILVGCIFLLFNTFL